MWLPLVLAAVHGAAIAQSVREQEIAECRNGEIVTWNDGVDRRAIHSFLRFSYRHRDAPPWFSEEAVRDMIARAAEAWAKCGVPAAMISPEEVDSRQPGFVSIEWSEAGSRGNFGLANLTQRMLSLNPAGFELLRTRNPKYDATQTLQMVISHEMGHFFGLRAHSRRCIDVLSYYHDSKGGKCLTRDPAGLKAVVEYRHILPTACDIARCRIANALE